MSCTADFTRNRISKIGAAILINTPEGARGSGAIPDGLGGQEAGADAPLRKKKGEAENRFTFNSLHDISNAGSLFRGCPGRAGAEQASVAG